MAGYRAIRGVSATLRTLLRDRMDNEVAVTLLSPDVEPADDTADRVNLFLYRVTPNVFLANQDMPGVGHPALPGHPPLSLVLHYLLTPFPAAEPDEDARALELLGDAMRVFHDYPIVTPGLERVRETPGEPILDLSLRNEFERVKLGLENINLEELSQIWSAFTVPYRLSALYAVSVVQIESQRGRRMAVPVETRRLQLTTLRRPQIDSVERATAANDARLIVGENLRIEGANFRGEQTWVRIGSLEPIWINGPAADEITLSLPDDEYPQDPEDPAPNPLVIPVEDRLQPGPQEVEVLVQRTVEVVQGGLGRGDWVEESRIQVSNRAVIMLVPEITSINPIAADAIGLLTVQGRRLFHEGRRCFVLVGDVMIEIRPPEPGDPWSTPTDTEVQVPRSALSTLVVGESYPVRVMVNGAQSRGLDILFQRT